MRALVCWQKVLVKKLKREYKNKKEYFFICQALQLGASLLRSMLLGKGIIQAGEGMIRAKQDF